MSPGTPQNMQYRIIRFHLHAKANGNARLMNVSIALSSPFSDADV